MKLGAKFTKEEYNSVLAVWRYTGYLMGIPETILYTDSEAATKTYKMGYMCEPTPDADSIAVANMLIDAIPAVADIKDPVEQTNLLVLAHRLSRALIGNRLVDAFEFPKPFNLLPTLFSYRMQQRVK